MAAITIVKSITRKKVVKAPVWMKLMKRACSYCNELVAVYGDGYSLANGGYHRM